MRFPSTLLEFQAQFPDDDHCWAYLRRARWPRGFLCPRCGGRGSHFLASRRLEQCRACRYQSSVTAGTVFHGTRAPLRVWFLGVFFLARHKKGVLIPFVEGAIRTPETTVHTDDWVSYKALGKLGINHQARKAGRGRQKEDGLPWAHTIFGNLKTWIRGTFHGVSPKHLQRYLNEFVFRFNAGTRTNSSPAFCSAQSARAPPPTTN